MLGLNLGALSDAEEAMLKSPQCTGDVVAIVRRAIDEIETARVYVITDNIAAGLAQAQSSLPPETPFGLSMLPCPNGYVYLEGRHLNAPHPDRPAGDVVRVVTWGVGPSLEEGGAAHVRIQLWVDRGPGPLVWRQNMLISEGHTWASALGGIEYSGDPSRIAMSSVESRNTAGTVLRFLLALGAFVSEKVVAVDPERPDRAWRRRMQREHPGAIEPEVNVVHMRELTHTSANRLGLGGPEWSCSWVVSSHWRRQFHPSTGDHALKWIRNYVKGDTHKPLRVSKPLVRYVDR